MVHIGLAAWRCRWTDSAEHLSALFIPVYNFFLSSLDSHRFIWCLGFLRRDNAGNELPAKSRPNTTSTSFRSLAAKVTEPFPRLSSSSLSFNTILLYRFRLLSILRVLNWASVTLLQYRITPPMDTKEPEEICNNGTNAGETLSMRLQGSEGSILTFTCRSFNGPKLRWEKKKRSSYIQKHFLKHLVNSKTSPRPFNYSKAYADPRLLMQIQTVNSMSMAFHYSSAMLLVQYPMDVPVYVATGVPKITMWEEVKGVWRVIIVGPFTIHVIYDYNIYYVRTRLTHWLIRRCRYRCHDETAFSTPALSRSGTHNLALLTCYITVENRDQAIPTYNIFILR